MNCWRGGSRGGLADRLPARGAALPALGALAALVLVRERECQKELAHRSAPVDAGVTSGTTAPCQPAVASLGAPGDRAAAATGSPQPEAAVSIGASRDPR